MMKVQDIRQTRTITHKGVKGLATVGYLLLVAVLYHYHVPCLFKACFGFPCMGCGMTRAYMALLHGDFAAAFAFHPMFWAVPILYLYILYDGKLFFNKRLNLGLLLALGAGFLCTYIHTLWLWFS